MHTEEFLTVKEAAMMLGVSDKTIRRRIAKGELRAELKESPYGQQYFIYKGEINTAQEILDVVKVQREYDVQELAIALAHYMEQRDSNLVDIANKLSQKVDSSVQVLETAIADLKEDNEKLKTEVTTYRQQLEKSQEEHFRSIDTKLKAILEDKNKKKTLFHKIFNR